MEDEEAAERPRRTVSRTRSRATENALKREGRSSANKTALSRQGKRSAAKRGKTARSESATEAARTRKAS
jgi:hypothetical protein